MVNFVKTFKRYAVLARNIGFKKTILKIILFLLSPLVSFRVVYKLDISKFIISPEKTNYIFFNINLSDLRLMYSRYKKEVTEKRFDYLKKIIKTPNSDCYTIKNSLNNICGYGCTALGKNMHQKIFNHMNDVRINKSAYLFRDYTFKKYRNIGVQTYLIKKRLELLKSKGYKTAIARIAVSNTASVRAYRKFGFRGELLEIHFHFFRIFPNSNFLLVKMSQKHYGDKKN